MEKIHLITSNDSPTLLESPHSLFKVDASLSPYAGCASSCVYCPFSSAKKIGVRTHFLHFLREKLDQEKRKLHLGLGLTCEPYCPEEGRFSVTHNTIELVMRHALPLQIFTRSPLVMKDRRLLREYSKQGLLAVNISMFTPLPEIAGIFEPDSPGPDARFELLRQLRKNDIFAGILLAPIVPYLSDTLEQLEEIFRRVKTAGGEYILPLVLSFPASSVQRKFKKAIAQSFPRVGHRLELLYGSDGMPSVTYTERMNDILKKLSIKHSIPLSLPLENGSPETVTIRHRLLR